MMDDDHCGQVIVGGQVIGRKECAYHAGGGLPSLACGAVDSHTEDAPIWLQPKSGTKMRWLDRERSEVRKGTLVTCEGNCDRMTYIVRPHRARSTVRVPCHDVLWASEPWRK